jgi:hypothetical protein
MLENTEGPIKNGQSRETGKYTLDNIEGQSKMDNLEKLANKR